ncbi:hypothetical protein VPH184E373B_0187 [Vibrio phage 184E37-3b]|nr:hypothetical protein MYOV056v2_p0163 [Vibrio phage 184E37.3a]QZI90143.1 hypothetical protein MYOV057v1_p0228 [Vibrio phage 184E37.1]
MPELKREDLINIKWDVRDWSEEQRTLWQQECFKLGMSWFCSSVAEIDHLDAEDYAFYYIEPTGILMHDDHDCETEFTELNFTEKQLSDMFPDYEAPKLINVVEEITQLFSEGMDKEDSEVDEDERGFEGLVYVEPKFIEKYYVIPLAWLSEEQSTFLNNTLDFHPHSDSVDEEVAVGLASLEGKGNWFFCTQIDESDTRISFNQLFKYGDEL